MKKAVAIINLHSGKKKHKKINIDNLKEIFKRNNYDLTIYVTKYKSHAKEIVMGLDNDIDLVVSVGGDGTCNEVVTGNLNREKQLLMSHIPYGSNNDIGAMFGLGKNVEKNLGLILKGEVQNIDVCKINEEYFMYVAGFGKFMNIPYETPRELKKKVGYIAYIVEGVKDFFKSKTRLYDLAYEINGETYRGLYSFLVVTNANRIAGINNFYNDVKLDDKNFEVLLCNLNTKKDIMRSLFYLKTNDIRKVPGFYFHKVSSLKVKFNEKLDKPWCIDGEKMKSNPLEYNISIVSNYKMLLPKKIDKRLFVNGREC